MIYPRNGKFCVLVYDQRAKRKVWVGRHADRDEAERAEQRAPAGARTLGYGDDTCDSFATRWPDDFPRPAIRIVATYRYALKRFIDTFHGLRLIDVDRPTRDLYGHPEDQRARERLKQRYRDPYLPPPAANPRHGRDASEDGA